MPSRLAVHKVAACLISHDELERVPRGHAGPAGAPTSRGAQGQMKLTEGA